jgi:hypothetical protein
VTVDDLGGSLPVATNGEIAAINLDSARRRSWRRFAVDPRRDGIAEAVVENERLSAEFHGDLDAFDRMEALAADLTRADPESARAALVCAQVACATHRFGDARGHLEIAKSREARPEVVHRQSLTLDQACGANLDAVLDARQRMVAACPRLEDMVPLGALLADMDRFVESDAVFRQALRAYGDVSPFPLAWVCFQLGLLWGELATAPDAQRAAAWYRHAIEYVPGYAKARVHLAEICMQCGRVDEALALLTPVAASGDPEVHWRLGEVLAAQEKLEDARAEIEAARSLFEALLARHPLAFADHAAEFYASNGNDRPRALELARANAANRPTQRALGLVRALAQEGA